MTNIKLSLAVALVIGVFGSTEVFAVDYGVSVFADVAESDNALRDDENRQSELQSEYGVAASLSDSSLFYLYDIDYRFSKFSYGEDSQPERGITEGAASLRLGKESGLFSVSANHSQSRTLIDRGEADTIDNSDERSILDVNPMLLFKVGSVDSINITGIYTKTRFDIQKQRNSDRTGGLATWAHALSPVSNMGVSVSVFEVEYTEIPDYVYDQQNAYFNYDASLRKLNYSLSLGYNLTKQNGEEYKAPSYDISFAYNATGQTFGAAFISRITDTSNGDNNRGAIMEEAEAVVDASALGADQFKLTAGDIFYRNTSLCGRCSLSLQVSREEEEYLSLTEESNTSNRGIATFAYSFKANTSFEYSYQRTKIEFEEDDLRDSIDSLSRVQLQQGFRFGLNLSAYYAARDRQSGTEGQGFTENLVGLRAEYILR